MSEISDSDTPQRYQCVHCQREFRRPQSLQRHVCEQGRRHLERNERGVQIGFAAFLRFFEITQGSARLKTWEDFATSAYYRAFVRFGRHCQAIRAVSVPDFVDWLLANHRKIDHWCKDAVYVEFLQSQIMRESMETALARAIEASLDWQERTGNPSKDYLRYGNPNALCHDISSARVTGWALYNCDTGRQLLASLNAEQISMIWCWIDSDAWARRFREYPADTAYAQQMLGSMGW